MRRLLSISICSSIFVMLASCGRTLPTQPGAAAGAPEGGDEPWLAAAGSGTWTAGAPMPIPRYGHAAGVIRNAQGAPVVYVFGGFDPSQNPGDRPTNAETVDAYDVTSDSWTTRNVRLAVSFPNGVGLIGGKFYLPGGGLESGEGFDWTNALKVYHPATDSYTRKADMPVPAAYGVSGVINGKLYVLAGTVAKVLGCPGSYCGPPEVSRRFYRYNPITDSWATRPWCPHPHVRGAAGVINGKLYVAGGRDSQGLTSALDIYDPASNTWSAGAPMPSARSGTGAVLGGKLYVIGEDGVIAYNPTTNRWTSKAPLLFPRSAAAVKVVFGGKAHLVALGGSVTGGSLDAGYAVEVYTP